jgi:hypothetical protein
MLLAYNASGDVIATLDYLVSYDPDGTPIGLVDFEAHEAAGGELLDVWNVHGEQIENGVGVPWAAAGSKTWPEWIGSKAHEFRVELVGPPGNKRIAALVHKVSGFRRVRSVVEANVAGRVAAYGPAPADIRDLVGGPARPLDLDDDGRTKIRYGASGLNLPVLPIHSRSYGG